MNNTTHWLGPHTSCTILLFHEYEKVHDKQHETYGNAEE